jgi:hypothetical protein
MSEFTMRPCRIGGRTAPNDYLVSYQGSPIGRIFHQELGFARWWIWAIQTFPAADGRSDTLEQAQAQLKAAVLALPDGRRIKAEGRVATLACPLSAETGLCKVKITRPL